MSTDDPPASEKASHALQDAGASQRPGAAQTRSLFSIPPPLKRIFDRFPLVTYAENSLPLRAQRRKDENVLYIFATAESAKEGRPSFNPSCLKWQTYLKLTGLSFTTVSSTNHASPSGALPFLIPAAPIADSAKPADPIPSTKLKRWLSAQTSVQSIKESDDVRSEAYASLLETSIRKAWLFQLYLSPVNTSLLSRLYVTPCSTNPLVQQTTLYQLRRAAESEILKASASGRIDERDIMREAEEAMDALATLLGEDAWFFGQTKPTVFDASVFAYTHLILDAGMRWEDNKLAQMMKSREILVQHRDRILEMYF